MQSNNKLRPELGILEYKQYNDAAWLRFKTRQLAEHFRETHNEFYKSRRVRTILRLYFNSSKEAKTFMHSLYEKKTKHVRNFARYKDLPRDEDGNKIFGRPLAHGNRPSASKSIDC